MALSITRKNPIEDEEVKRRAAEQAAIEAAKPADWAGGSYGQSLKDTLDKINNREKFVYDLNADMLYNQYKDQYINAGKMAMADTMGQAAALTGGYGNSYAATVGNQAYQSYLQQLNNKVPELYQLAYNRYQQEGQDLKDRYSLYSDMYNREYGESQDAYNRWNANRSRADSLYQAALDYAANEANTEYNNVYNSYWADTNYAYQQARDKAADEQWAKQFAETQRQNQIANEQWEKNFALQQANAARSGSSSGAKGSTNNENTIDYTKVNNYKSTLANMTEDKAREKVDAWLNSNKITFVEADALYEYLDEKFKKSKTTSNGGLLGALANAVTTAASSAKSATSKLSKALK